MRVLVTGANGKLAQSVLPILKAEGYDVVAWGKEIDLTDRQQIVQGVTRLLDAPVDALVHLAGGYEEGSHLSVLKRMVEKNVKTFDLLAQSLTAWDAWGGVPTIVAIGHPFDMPPADKSNAFAYVFSKELLKTSVYEVATNLEGYASVIEPSGAIDTDEKRDDIAFRIADAISAPITHEKLESYDREAC